MAVKQFDIPGIGPVTIHKRRGTKNIRLSVQRNGTVRVTQPPWVPYTVGQEFARSRADWIQQHQQSREQPNLISGQRIGKQHTLLFKQSEADKLRTKVGLGLITVTLGRGQLVADAASQKAARLACVRALRQEAESLLPSRLHDMAVRHELNYRSVNVRSLSGRWGSCDSEKNIVLNLYLMLLPWELIDYVLLHELTHTVVMKHGPDFWQQMARFDPSTPQHRKAIREHQPTI